MQEVTKKKQTTHQSPSQEAVLKESENRQEVVARLQFWKLIEKSNTTELIITSKSSDSSGVEKVTTHKDTNKKKDKSETKSREQN